MEEIILSASIYANADHNDLTEISDDEKAAAVAFCLPKIKRLRLNCWIKENGAQYLADGLQELSRPV